MRECIITLSQYIWTEWDTKNGINLHHHLKSGLKIMSLDWQGGGGSYLIQTIIIHSMEYIVKDNRDHHIMPNARCSCIFNPHQSDTHHTPPPPIRPRTREVKIKWRKPPGEPPKEFGFCQSSLTLMSFRQSLFMMGKSFQFSLWSKNS